MQATPWRSANRHAAPGAHPPCSTIVVLWCSSDSGRLLAAEVLVYRRGGACRAERLIRKQHFFKTGVGVRRSSSAGGRLRDRHVAELRRLEAILASRSAAVLSGWRLRDAFFGVCALMLVIVYVAVKWNDISMTMTVAAVRAVAAGVALRRQWKRPSRPECALRGTGAGRDR